MAQDGRILLVTASDLRYSEEIILPENVRFLALSRPRYS
jgi:hypothetical protein